MKSEYFAIGEGRSVWLLCEHRKRGIGEPRRPGMVYGRVINGAWDFTLENGILTVLAKGTTHKKEIVWEGVLPDGLGNYREAMIYIERRLSCWPITNFVIDRSIRAKEYGKRVRRAWRAAVRNFKVVYRENSEFVQDEDDLICF